MTLLVGVQVDSVIDFNTDNTFVLMQEALRRGYKLFHYTPNKLILKSGVPCALARPVDIVDREFVFGEERLLVLDDLDVLLMRQNPPFNIQYITGTYILEKCQNVLIINDPCGVRNFPEKIKITSSLPTLITEDITLIQDFVKEHTEVVLKPLYSYGGQGVSYVRGGISNAGIVAQMIQDTFSSHIVVQKFCSEIINGDKRVTMLDGKVFGVFSRIPKNGEFRSNLCLNNDFAESSLTSDESQLCEEIGLELKEHGILLAGIDVIGGSIIEVNVTSPTGLSQINSLYGKKSESDVWDCFEGKLS